MNFCRNVANGLRKCSTIWVFAEMVANFCESSMKFPKPNELFIIQSLWLLVIHSLAPMTVGLKSISLLGRWWWGAQSGRTCLTSLLRLCNGGRLKMTVHERERETDMFYLARPAQKDATCGKKHVHCDQSQVSRMFVSETNCRRLECDVLLGCPKARGLKIRGPNWRCLEASR